MANQEHVDRLLHEGVAEWNQWRSENPGILPDLSDAALSRAALREANLVMANLTAADLTGANLSHANLSSADLTGANLTAADLSLARCLHTNFRDATLAGCTVVNIYASRLNPASASAIQTDLRITPRSSYTRIRVDNLQVAQFLDMLLHNDDMRAVLDSSTTKVVVLLGRFRSDRQPLLADLCQALRRHPKGYIPVRFDFLDVEVALQPNKPRLETLKRLANLARFVIADLTDPHMIRAELTAIIPNVPTLPVQPIIEGDAGLPAEYASWALFKSFLPVYRYVDLPQLLASLTETVITPVEAHVQARKL